jgi:flavin reductase (DIM6/NTAB) family NADH-FMN oxidoreductase RutF
MTGHGTDDAATNENANDNVNDNDHANDHANGDSARQDEFDRHRRRVLWALPTGLYLIGSRHGDEANLMTANLVVQVCLEPKLVGVALERDSMTARLVGASGAFTISLLQRGDRDVVRRFVKPVTDVSRDADGVIVAMSGHPVSEVGSQRLPVFSAAAGHLACAVTRAEPLGSHTFCIGEVTDVSGEPDEVLRMEDTRMHYGG